MTAIDGVADLSPTREKLLAGVHAVADAVRLTFGPRSRHVLFETGAGPVLADDGRTIAQAVTLADPEENLGARVLREAAERCVELAGDGAAASLLLAEALVDGGFERITAGANPQDLKRGFDRALQIVIQHLRSHARPGSGSRRQLQVACAASHDDTGTAEIVVRVLKSVGPHGQVTVEETHHGETTVEISKAGEEAADAASTAPARTAVIHVGGYSETETRIRVNAFNVALSATRAAIDDGIVAGGGVALLRTLPALGRATQEITGDESAGMLVVMRALETPLRQLALNAGGDPEDVISRVSSESGAFGFDAATGRTLDLFDAGIVDPVRVVCTSIETAVSVAGILLLSDTTLIHEAEAHATVGSAAAPSEGTDGKTSTDVDELGDPLDFRLSGPPAAAHLTEAGFESGLDALDSGLGVEKDSGPPTHEN